MSIDKIDFQNLKNFLHNPPHGFVDSLIHQQKIEDVDKFLFDVEVAITTYVAVRDRNKLAAFNGPLPQETTWEPKLIMGGLA